MECTRRTLLMALAAPAPKRRIAVTVDDFQWQTVTPEGRRAWLAVLDKEGIQAAAFAIGRPTFEGEGRKVLEDWAVAGHMICNHTWSHPNYNSPDVSFESYSADVARWHAPLSKFRGFQPYFRFPFLKEGETREKRDAMRAWLRREGYRNGHVAVDTSDWRLASRFRETKAPDAKTWSSAYVEHMVGMLRFYGDLGRDLQLATAPLTLLIHYNELNARFLGDVIRRFRSEGWEWISAAAAFQDPLYRREADTVPGGESLLWLWLRKVGSTKTGCANLPTTKSARRKQ